MASSSERVGHDNGHATSDPYQTEETADVKLEEEDAALEEEGHHDEDQAATQHDYFGSYVSAALQHAKEEPHDENQEGVEQVKDELYDDDQQQNELVGARTAWPNR